MQIWKGLIVLLLVVGACKARGDEGSLATHTVQSEHSANHALMLKTKGEIALERVSIGRDRCSRIDLKSRVVVEANAVTWRPVVLCVHGEKTGWHDVFVAIPYPVPKVFTECARRSIDGNQSRCGLPITVEKPDLYAVAHERGWGPTHFTATVFDRATGERLSVYATRFAWFADEATPPSVGAARAIKAMRSVTYTPYGKHLAHDEIERHGAELLRGEIVQVLIELDRQKVVSRFQPGISVSSVVPWEYPFLLAIIEQGDQALFEQAPFDTLRAVMIGYGTNLTEAYTYIVSNASAQGPMQLTDRGGKGTYSAIRENYPEADLEPNFKAGARNLHNALKAAILLIDLELSGFPYLAPQVEDGMGVVMAYVAAAYNGGALQARRLERMLRKLDPELAITHPLALQDAIRTVLTNCTSLEREHAGICRLLRALHPETRGYLAKLSYLLTDPSRFLLRYVGE